MRSHATISSLTLPPELAAAAGHAASARYYKQMHCAHIPIIYYPYNKTYISFSAGEPNQPSNWHCGCRRRRIPLGLLFELLALN